MDAKVSVILPVHNGEKWLDECLDSLSKQTSKTPIELCVHNDASNDQSMSVLKRWTGVLKKRKIDVTLTENTGELPRGILSL